MANRIEDSWLLRERFLALLDQEEDEQVYQDFIEKNTKLVPREFIQNHGIHMDLVFRKLSLGNDYTTDFCYLSKSSDNWNIVLIEIEKPQSRYFRDDSRLHPDFQAALEQITRWRAWFSNTPNLDAFVNGTLGQLRIPLEYNPCWIKYVLVHGRRAEFEGNKMRMSIIRECEKKEDFQILSYDSLVEALDSKEELYLAVRKNDHIEIPTRRYISEVPFVYLPPSYLKITDELRSSILENRASWRHISLSSSHKYVLEDRLPKIGVLRETRTA